jgi:beta-glucuronidase
MIRPQTNAFRQAHDLSGVWRVRFGEENGSAGLAGGADVHDIAVPGSWNEQLAEAGYMNYVGPAWLETEFVVPAGERRLLRFGSADYAAEVWVDGQRAGRSGAAMLPFELDVTELTVPGRTARLVVRVTNELPVEGPTQRVTFADYRAEGRLRDEYWPAVRFDFFPYGGLNRPVHCVTRGAAAIRDYRVSTRMDGTVAVRAEAEGGAQLRLIVGDCVVEGAVDAEIALTIAAPRLWSPTDPFLYPLVLQLLDGTGEVVDEVGQMLGLRELSIDGNRLLLNGEPVTLRGFGKHEDSPIRGRGLDLPLLVKDFRLLKWTGANSVRTSHYPYAEEFYDFADRNGILVIDEVFSVNLDFRKVTGATLAAHKQAVTELVARDRNRTCVIAWSLANEPGYLGEAAYRECSRPYWAELFGHARALDPTRPLTHANVGYAGLDDPAFHEADIVTLNRYHGWYSEPGQLDRAVAALGADLDAAAEHGKPVFLAEFGADALAGQHAPIALRRGVSGRSHRGLLARARRPSRLHRWACLEFRRFPHGPARAAGRPQYEGCLHPYPRAQACGLDAARTLE